MRAFARHTEYSKGRLLVVDDDLVQRTIIGRIGAKLGYDAVIASTFDIASELLQTQAFDIMTLDLSLGERDGVELLRLIADLKLNAMPIVVISGCEERILNTTRRVGQALSLSLSCCLAKPLNLDNLREALQAPALDRVASAGEAPALAIDRERIMAGLSGNEFYAEFQPKVDLRTGHAIGAEALARWRLPEFGVVSPVVFIPLVEKFGLMPELTNRILSSAIADARKLVQQHPGFAVAVNLSSSLLTDLTLPERIEGILRQEGVAAESLIVEVTESVAMSDVDAAMDILVRLRIKGIGTAIDDFGTGFSSLSALAKLPFSELKIDQSFVKGCDTDEDMMKVVEASIGLARAFRMKVVAEGIDSPHTLARIRHAGCDVGQGYLFAPSLRFERAESWFADRNARSTEPLEEIGAR
jgi:EAL domain-containing protein (putative c-di-GMP-specific phosphodiesterase class I)